MTQARILIAGVGNIFLGDDGFGVEVARRLAERPWPEGVRVVDFGIRGIDLAYALLDDYDVTIIVDALQRGGSPGMLYVLEPDLREFDGPPAPDALVSPHSMHPHAVLRTVKAMGGEVGMIRIVGCEPATFGSDEDPTMALSGPVAAAVDEAVAIVEQLVQELEV